jgi:hypothetical protein
LPTAENIRFFEFSLNVYLAEAQRHYLTAVLQGRYDEKQIALNYMAAINSLRALLPSVLYGAANIRPILQDEEEVA